MSISLKVYIIYCNIYLSISFLHHDDRRRSISIDVEVDIIVENSSFVIVRRQKHANRPTDRTRAVEKGGGLLTFADKTAGRSTLKLNDIYVYTQYITLVLCRLCILAIAVVDFSLCPYNRLRIMHCCYVVLNLIFFFYSSISNSCACNANYSNKMSCMQ